MSTTEALQIARDALDEIALAGMSGSGQESQEGMRDWHARRAWDFIAIAARANQAVAAALAATSAPAVDALQQMEERKDAAYLERNQVVAALAKAFPSGVARTAIEAQLTLAAPQPAPAVPDEFSFYGWLNPGNGTVVRELNDVARVQMFPLHTVEVLVRTCAKASAVPQPEAPAEPPMIYAMGLCASASKPAAPEPMEAIHGIEQDSSDDQIREILDTLYSDLVRGKRTNGGMVGDLWNLAVYRRAFADGLAAEVEERRELTNVELLAARAPSRSQKLAAAGYTARDKKLPCDECGERLSMLGLQVHECAQPEAQAEPSTDVAKALMGVKAPDYLSEGDAQAFLAGVCAARLIVNSMLTVNAPAEPSAEIDAAIQHLVKSAWTWGESCGEDGVSWDKPGDSHNEWMRSNAHMAERELRKLLATPPAAEVEERRELSDEEIGKAVIAALADMNAGSIWDRYTYESGPYEITTCRPEVIVIGRAILAKSKEKAS